MHIHVAALIAFADGNFKAQFIYFFKWNFISVHTKDWADQEQSMLFIMKIILTKWEYFMIIFEEECLNVHYLVEPFNFLLCNPCHS